jgi:hypothetical protein
MPNRKRRTLLTLDEDFADLRLYPLGNALWNHPAQAQVCTFISSYRVLDAAPPPSLQQGLLEQGSLVISDGVTYRIRTP